MKNDLEKFFEDLEDEDEGDVSSFKEPRSRLPVEAIKLVTPFVSDTFQKLLSVTQRALYDYEDVKNYLRDKGLGDDMKDGIWDCLEEELDRLTIPILEKLIEDKKNWLGSEVEHYDPLH